MSGAVSRLTEPGMCGGAGLGWAGAVVVVAGRVGCGELTPTAVEGLFGGGRSAGQVGAAGPQEGDGVVGQWAELVDSIGSSRVRPARPR